jgi:ribosome-associated translation inhibitor RaiA
MNTITCKHCGKEIEITEALLHQVEDKVKKEVSKYHEEEIEKARIDAAQKARKELEEKQSLEFADLKIQLEEQKKKNGIKQGYFAFETNIIIPLSFSTGL